MGRDQDITTDKDPVTAVTRKEKELTALDLERARDGSDLGEKFGRQNISSTTTSKVALETKKKEDEKFENAMRQLLQQMREELARRLEEFDRRIVETNAKIEELREELETTEAHLKKQFGRDWQEKLRRGELDPNDPLVRQWLMQQQQLKDYLDRRKELIKERDELEKQITEIESSNLTDELKLERMKVVLEEGTAPGVHEVWRDNAVSTQGQEIAGAIYTDDGVKLEADNTSFPGLATASIAGNGEFGKGLEAKTGNIKSKFANAAELSTTEQLEPFVSNIPTSKPPKLSG